MRRAAHWNGSPSRDRAHALLQAQGGEGLQLQLQDFGIGLQPRVTVDFGTKLQGLAGGKRTVWAGVQHGAAVAQAGHASTIEQMGVKVAIALCALLTGCQTYSGSFCSIASPIRPEATDVALMSDSLANQILAQNEKGQALCGWRP